MREDTTLAPGTLVDEYIVEAEIGRGGSGQVYSTVHRLIGKRAAIKVLHHSATNLRELDRLLAEARSVNRIGHPNIVDVFAFGTLEDGRSYIVMELLRGECLADRMKRGAMERTELVPILLQTCDALEAAHRERIVHRDLKPENIFLVPAGGSPPMVKLLDFGIAKALEEDERSNSTSEGLILGTPLYLAPEQALGKGVDERADLYALGALCFELFLDRPPFVGETSVSFISQHLTRSPPPPERLWPENPPTALRPPQRCAPQGSGGPTRAGGLPGGARPPGGRRGAGGATSGACPALQPRPDPPGLAHRGAGGRAAAGRRPRVQLARRGPRGWMAGGAAVLVAGVV